MKISNSYQSKNSNPNFKGGLTITRLPLKLAPDVKTLENYGRAVLKDSPFDVSLSSGVSRWTAGSKEILMAEAKMPDGSFIHATLGETPSKETVTIVNALYLIERIKFIAKTALAKLAQK